jgi:hypothetical protein
LRRIGRSRSGGGFTRLRRLLDRDRFRGEGEFKAGSLGAGRGVSIGVSKNDDVRGESVLDVISGWRGGVGRGFGGGLGTQEAENRSFRLEVEASILQIQ